MIDVVYERLKQAAREKRLVTYGELAAALEIMLSDRANINKLGTLLEEIADQERSADRPLLVALTVSEDTNMPGAGLFKYARRNGLMKRKTDLEFFAEEVMKAYDYWADK